MQNLNVVDEPLVVMFARLAAIGRALRDPRGTADLGELCGQTQDGGGGLCRGERLIWPDEVLRRENNERITG